MLHTCSGAGWKRDGCDTGDFARALPRDNIYAVPHQPTDYIALRSASPCGHPTHAFSRPERAAAPQRRTYAFAFTHLGLAKAGSAPLACRITAFHAALFFSPACQQWLFLCYRYPFAVNARVYPSLPGLRDCARYGGRSPTTPSLVDVPLRATIAHTYCKLLTCPLPVSLRMITVTTLSSLSW